MRKVYFLLLALLSATVSWGQIAAWDFTGENNVATSAAEVYNANMDASNLLTRGAGAAASAGANSFRTVGFQNNGISTANTDYFQFTLSASVGYTLSLSTIDAKLTGTSSFAVAPGVSSQFAYSLDGTNFTLIGSPSVTVGAPATLTQIDLSGITALQNVAADVTITLRYYASGQTTTGGWGYFSASSGDYGLAIGGSLTLSSSNSTSSDIILNTGFTPTANIDYTAYQAADITDANSLIAAQFIIQDGGGTADADAVGTTLTAISFSLSNSANIRSVALYDGATELGEVAGAPTVSFTGLTLTAADDANKTFTIRVTFNTTVTDNQQFVFTVSSATADGAGSLFAAGNAGAAASSTDADDNRIEVIADRLAYAQNTTSPTGLNVAMFPAVTVSANDINGNRDLDFTETIRITSSGTLSGSPVDVAAVAGLASFGSLTHTATGTGLTLNAERMSTLDWDVASNPFDIQIATSATDYFRSAASGDWNSTATWESSPDNSTWISATLVPNQNANTITIRNGQTVTISTAVTADQVVIEGGAVLSNTGNVFTVNDGAGDDVIVEDGGIFTLASSSSSPVFSTGATANINTGAILRVSKSGYTGAGTGMNAASFIYQNGSIAEYTLTGAFSSSGVTYFPNVDASTIPIFRTTANVSAGSGGTTIFNGVFEAAATTTFTGAGTKTFRNGLIGAGTMNGAASGKFIINGATAQLGLNVTVPTTDGLEIGSGTVVTVSASKTITGNVSLLAPSSVNLGSFDLSVTGSITGGTTSSYIKTNGSGHLIMTNVTTARSFPVGNGTYNPVTISNGSGHDWSVNVEDNLVVTDPAFSANAAKAVNRTWNIAPSVNPPAAGADIVFEYDDSDPSQLGASFNTGENVQVWHKVGADWLAAGGGQTPSGAAGGVRTVTLTNWSGFSPLAISNSSAPLPVIFGNVKASQSGSGVKVDWSNLTETDVINYNVERSTDGRNFATVGSINALLNNGGKADYSFIDAAPASGVNYYRIISWETTGKSRYSTIVKVDLRGGATNLVLYPNPVADGQLSFQATSLIKGQYAIRIFNAAGQQVFSRMFNHAGGSVTEALTLPEIKTGVYSLQLSGGAVNLVRAFIVR